MVKKQKNKISKKLEKELKKLKPIELSLNHKGDKKKVEDNIVQEDLEKSSNFRRDSTDFIPSGDFVAPRLKFENSLDTQETNLEDAAASVITPSREENPLSYSPASSSGSYSDSTSYLNSGKKYSADGTEIRPAIPLISEDLTSRRNILNPMVFNSDSGSAWGGRNLDEEQKLRSELESFRIQQEKARIERETQNSLPFKRKSHKREIF